MGLTSTNFFSRRNKELQGNKEFIVLSMGYLTALRDRKESADDHTIKKADKSEPPALQAGKREYVNPTQSNE
jgi:hypothetical protein